MSFSPYIDLDREETWCWRYESRVKSIIVKAENLVKSKPLYTKVIRAGCLRDYLKDFNGKITLQSIMHDSYFKRFQVEQFCEMGLLLNPDEITIMDCPFYKWDMKKTTKTKILAKLFEDAKKLTNSLSSVKIIALAKGELREVDLCCKAFNKIGIDTIGIPCGHYFIHPSNRNKRQLLERALFVKKQTKELRLFGFASPYDFMTFGFVDTFCSNNWWVAAEKGGKIFTKEGPKMFENKDCKDVLTAAKLNLKFIFDKIDNMKKNKNLMEVISKWEVQLVQEAEQNIQETQELMRVMPPLTII